MDRAEFERLYATYASDVYRLALSYLHSVHDAQDICHDVFAKLLCRSIQLPSEKEKAFLLTCTANACKDVLRSFWRTRVEALEETIPYNTQRDLALWDAIGKLPPKYRAVIHLYYYEGYSTLDIASYLGCPHATVRSRLSRARKTLKKKLGGDF